MREEDFVSLELTLACCRFLNRFNSENPDSYPLYFF